MIEVVVIGGGLAGAAAALALADRGVAVNVIDAERPGSAATGASAGMLAPQYESAGRGELYRVLVQSRQQYPAFVERLEALASVRVGLRYDGMLVANLTAAEHAEAAAMLAWQRDEGQHGELIDGGEALRLQQGVATDVHSWLWLPDEGQVDAQQVAAALPAALGAAGVRVISGHRAVAVRSGGGAVDGVVLEDGRTLGADVVIIAAGAWSDAIGGLPRRLGVRPVRGHLLRFVADAVRTIGPVRLVSSHAGRYLVPRNDGSLLAGSTMDESGFDRSIDDTRLRTIHDDVARLMPALRDCRPGEYWADLRPLSVDGLPIVGAEPELRGLFYATGYGRNGILIAPLAGSIIADMVLDRVVPAEWLAFSPARSGGRTSGERLSVNG